MRYTIEFLLNGDHRVVDYYIVAHQRWREILSSGDAESVEGLASKLTYEQIWFESNCGGRWEGQEIMVLSGIGHLYDQKIGFNETREVVLRVYDALMASYCSIEVKWHAQRTAKEYNIEDLREEGNK